ncbi:pre-rRNA 2'-O-ribose RNA methyltransferase FTSJ3 [Triplophysa rosa]|uniref:pre-rRNA processing protein FTSJ3 n=1 Tax=Triplophysa rosa TaxID=992332 RepID=A0A9W7T3D9_TRIRA|nr:pre-rRNA 2'-O-ribose RNA methyltransferase FTSJ3 [Triplophysa rosa]KAI7790930.1 putative pre-rRNA processing protein FTSJ3-like [Triplophysa rosa]
MGKKVKVGKTRKDKFYHLAKETGYRSRSSFKLIQLNRKFQFLQKARALVDLCAAPGGWLQVASKFMPVSSLVIGVDLVPIKPIPNVVTLQEDITTDKCKQALRKELQTWKVDVVLNDGAPNVGANWQHDAFSQAHLSLMALKLACEFLNKGGTFITKVFRSKDYQPLMWIFQQFFKKVQATKPQASRNESAEIFVVCQGFLAPDKIDNKFFDPKHAFKEVDVQVKTVKELVTTKKPKAEGYNEGDLTLYRIFPVTQFLQSENPVDFLSKANEITFDSPELESHPVTLPEIKECCRDIKVLGRKELRLLLSWRSKLRRFIAKKLKEEAKQTDQEIRLSSDEEESDTDLTESRKKDTVKDAEEKKVEEDEDEEMEKKLAEMKADEISELKRKKKKLLKEQRKKRERVALKMDLPGVSIADGNDTSMFSLSTIKKAQGLREITQGDMKGADALVEGGEEEDLYFSESEDDRVSLASDLDSDDLEEIEKNEEQIVKNAPKKKTVSFAAEENEDADGNELLVALEGKDEKKERETDMWFSKGIFAELKLYDDRDAMSELKQTQFLQSNRSGSFGIGRKRKAEEEAEPSKEEEEVAAPSQEAGDEDDSDSDDDSSDDETEISQMKKASSAAGAVKTGGDDEFQVVPVERTSKRARILNAEGLALGAQIATSKKRMRDLVDGSFHRFSNSEGMTEIPAWFVDDENKHRKRPVPVTKEMVEEYKQKWREIKARPIKKVAEAKARKKRRMLRKMEQAKKKAETVVNTVDISEREKMSHLKRIYKKAGMAKEKRKVTYVVAKKGAGRKVRRPAGVKGTFRVVDGRMKKDMQRKDQKGHGKGGKGQKKGRGDKKGRGGKPPKGRPNRK